MREVRSSDADLIGPVFSQELTADFFEPCVQMISSDLFYVEPLLDPNCDCIQMVEQIDDVALVRFHIRIVGPVGAGVPNPRR